MFRNRLSFILALAALCLAAPAFATPNITVSLDHVDSFYPCAEEGRYAGSDRQVKATATLTGGASNYRVSWNTSGPTDGNGDAANHSTGLTTFGADLKDDYLRDVQCDEWGKYTVTATLYPPSGNNTPIMTASVTYDASYKSPLVWKMISERKIKNCGVLDRFTADIRDQDGRIPVGVQMVVEAVKGSSYGANTGIVSSLGTATIDVTLSPKPTADGVADAIVYPGTIGFLTNPLANPEFLSLSYTVSGCPADTAVSSFSVIEFTQDPFNTGACATFRFGVRLFNSSGVGLGGVGLSFNVAGFDSGSDSATATTLTTPPADVGKATVVIDWNGSPPTLPAFGDLFFETSDHLFAGFAVFRLSDVCH